MAKLAVRHVVVYNHLTGSDFKKGRSLTGRAGKLFASICHDLDRSPDYPGVRIPVFDSKAINQNAVDTFFTAKQSPYSLKIAPPFNGLYLRNDYHKSFNAFKYRIKEANPFNILALGEIAAWATTNVQEGSIKTRMENSPYMFASLEDKSFFRVFVGPSLQMCYDEHPDGERNLKRLRSVMREFFASKSTELELV